MKATGIVRKVDQLGRIVIPKEIRTSFEVNDQDPLEIFVDGRDIILRKYRPACIFCNEATDVIQVEGINICRSCLKKLQKIR